MILKLEDLKVIETLDKSDIIWCIYDHIENIKHCRLKYDPDIHIGFDFILVDEEIKEMYRKRKKINVTKDNPLPPLPNIISIYFTTKTNSYTVVTSKMAFIMNDEGKTIERIN